MYYSKIETYIDYLFEKHPSWAWRTDEVGAFIYKELGNGIMCGIPEDICFDKTPKTLKKLMTNLVYLWVVHHSETFSMISTNNLYYMAPTFVSKSLAEADEAVKNPDYLDQHGALKEEVKHQWFAPLPVFNNAMAIMKSVTVRADQENLVSSWSTFGVDDPSIGNWMVKNRE